MTQQVRLSHHLNPGTNFQISSPLPVGPCLLWENHSVSTWRAAKKVPVLFCWSPNFSGFKAAHKNLNYFWNRKAVKETGLN